MTSNSSSSWEPVLDRTVTRSPTKNCLTRIRKDLKEMMKNPLQGIYCIQDDTIATLLHAIIMGPFDTPYEGGFFYFILDCPDDYPFSSPKVKIMTTGGGQVRFNPNLYANGKVCLSILGTWSGPGWSPIQSLSSVLLSIQSLMSENPYHNEPGFESANREASTRYNDVIRHETLRIAVAEMCGDTSMHHTLPTALAELVRSLFPSFIDFYNITCDSNAHRDGQRMMDPYDPNRGIFAYAHVKNTLAKVATLLGCSGGGEKEEEEEEAATAGTGAAVKAAAAASSEA